MVFRWLQNGAPVQILDFASAPVNAGSMEKEMLANYMGSPSAQFVWAVPQDGIAAPVDFNASASAYLRSVWNGTVLPAVATLTGPDGSGYYTVTLTGTTVPANAVMFTGGMGYSYNARSAMPLTQTNLTAYPVTKSVLSGLTAGMPNAWGGLIVIAPNKQVVAAGFTGRRAIVEDKRCNSCHQELGTFTEDAFHAGQRNDGTTCSWYHNPNRNSSGRTADSTQFVHGIHGAEERTVPYTWHAVSADDNFSKIVYPGVIARCEQCHVPGSYDFSNSASADAAESADGTNKREFRYITGNVAANVSKADAWLPLATMGRGSASRPLPATPACCSPCRLRGLPYFRSGDQPFQANGGGSMKCGQPVPAA